MARQDDRGSDTKRHRSRFDPEHSPKRCRRDVKPTSERPPLEAPKVRDSKESEKKSNGNSKGTKRSSEITQNPRSHSSYIQQNERRGNGNCNSTQVGRSFTHRGNTEKDLLREKSNRTGGRKDDDRYFERDPPLKKRPAFREEKIPKDSVRSGLKSDKPELGHGSRFSAADRYGRRDGFTTPRQDNLSGRVHHVEEDKWKHDLYHEANKSPTSKKEEDQIAKVEALLSS